MALLDERLVVGSPTLLISSKDTVFKVLIWMTAKSKMESYESVVLYLYLAILIIYRSTIKRVTHYLAPVLMTGVIWVVVEIVLSADMVGYL